MRMFQHLFREIQVEDCVDIAGALFRHDPCAAVYQADPLASQEARIAASEATSASSSALGFGRTCVSAIVASRVAVRKKLFSGVTHRINSSTAPSVILNTRSSVAASCE